MVPLTSIDLSSANKGIYVFKFQKTKALLLSFLFSLLSFTIKGQINYVLNPSFEQVDSCPSYFHKIKALFWDTLINGGGFNPDLMTPCYVDPSAAIIVGVPLNIYGRSYQWPRTGKNYHNFLLYQRFNSNDYIQGNLYKVLATKKYCVTYYVNLSNNSKYAMDRIGAVIDDGSIQSPPGQTTVVPASVASPSNVFMSDTLNWMKVQGLFMAKGNETKITIGNFNLISSTNTILVNSVAIDPYALYFIDDVSVIEADLPAYAGRDTVLCAGDSVFIGRPPEIGLECLWFNNGSQIATGGGLWVKPATTQTYIVNQDVCGLIKKDTIQVQIKPKYTGANIGIAASTATTCPTNTVILNIINNPPVSGTYNWLPLGVYTQTGNALAKAQIPNTTTFTLNLNNNGQNAFCPFQQTSSVTVAVPLYTSTPIITNNINPICPSDTILLNLPVVPGNSVTYTWLPSLAFTFTNNVIAKSVINQTTTYTLNISSSGNNSLCPFTSKVNTTINVADTCFKDPQIPNIFTPNNDDVNDVWQIKFPLGYKLNALNIYNRWGTLIYERNNLSFNIQNLTLLGWDGRTTSGEECTAGIYFYVLNYTDKYGNDKVAKGNITLMK